MQSEHSCKVNIPLYFHIHTQPYDYGYDVSGVDEGMSIKDGQAFYDESCKIALDDTGTWHVGSVNACCISASCVGVYVCTQRWINGLAMDEITSATGQ